MKPLANHSNHVERNARRLVLKRLALLGAVAVAPAFLGSVGCQALKDAFGGSERRKESKTIDDVLSEERPSW